MSETLGRIVIKFVEGGRPEISIEGQIPGRIMRTVPVLLKRAYRSHVAQVRRDMPKADMSDKGTQLADLSKEEVEDMNSGHAGVQGDINVIPTPDQMEEEGKQQQELEDEFLPLDEDMEAEEANNPIESEAPNGTERGSEEGSGNVKGPETAEGASKRSWR